jgi:hypothetical protein
MVEKIALEGSLSFSRSLEVRVRVYYSTYHLWAAKQFTRIAREIEDAHSAGDPVSKIEHRAYVTGALVSSVAFMEAAINEILQDAAENHQSYTAPLDQETQALLAAFWRLMEDRGSRFPILDKYQFALSCSRQVQFPKGENPYQDAALLIRLRNELVHYKPKTLGRSDTHKLDDLKHKFPPSKLMEGTGNPYFPDKCLGYGCAEWAVNSSKNFADSFFEKIGVVPNYQRVSHENG